MCVYERERERGSTTYSYLIKQIASLIACEPRISSQLQCVNPNKRQPAALTPLHTHTHTYARTLDFLGGCKATGSGVKQFSRHTDVNKSDVAASYTSLVLLLYNANKWTEVQIITVKLYITPCQVKSAQPELPKLNLKLMISGSFSVSSSVILKDGDALFNVSLKIFETYVYCDFHL